MIYNSSQPRHFHNYDWLCRLASTIIFYEGGKVIKPIIVVKMPGCKLLYIIQVKGFSWPYIPDIKDFGRL